MAEAGFYLVGNSSEPDLVRCYYCRRELDGWEPTDVPWEEHKRRGCPFISLGKLAQDLTIEDVFHLEAERKCCILVRVSLSFSLHNPFRILNFVAEGSQRCRGKV